MWAVSVTENWESCQQARRWKMVVVLAKAIGMTGAEIERCPFSVIISDVENGAFSVYCSTIERHTIQRNAQKAHCTLYLKCICHVKKHRVSGYLEATKMIVLLIGPSCVALYANPCPPLLACDVVVVVWASSAEDLANLEVIGGIVEGLNVGGAVSTWVAQRVSAHGSTCQVHMRGQPSF